MKNDAHMIATMLKQTDIYVDTSVLINGWVRSVRTSKNVSFIVINDGSTLSGMQVVCSTELLAQLCIERIATGASITVSGTLVKSAGAKQAVEVQAEHVVIVGDASDDYPLQKKRHSFEFLRNIAHLRPRSNTFSAVARVRHALAYAIHQFFHERNFLWVHTPIISASDAEGAGELFSVSTLKHHHLLYADHTQYTEGVPFADDFFGKETFLAVSGQLHAETYAMALGNVYTFGPTFRAENSNTTRHAAEFWMVEPECAFADNTDNMALAEALLRYCIAYVLTHCSEDMAFFEQWIEKDLLAVLHIVAHTSFEQISYTEAIKLLQKSGASFTYKPEWGAELQTEHERYLCEQVVKAPVIVYDYPKESKAFYMMRNDDGKTVRGMDVLVPRLGEIMGGSQREHRYDILCQSLRENNLSVDDYAWYLDLRQYGSAPHSGFGLGFDRLLMYITGMQNIRDVIPFPRVVGSAKF